MTDHLIASVVSVVTAIIGLAIIAVLVAQKAQTGNVISAASAGLANDLAAAVSPVTGSSVQINTGSGGFGFGGFSGMGAPIGNFGN